MLFSLLVFYKLSLNVLIVEVVSYINFQERFHYTFACDHIICVQIMSSICIHVHACIMIRIYEIQASLTWDVFNMLNL